MLTCANTPTLAGTCSAGGVHDHAGSEPPTAGASGFVCSVASSGSLHVSYSLIFRSLVQQRCVARLESFNGFATAVHRWRTAPEGKILRVMVESTSEELLFLISDESMPPNPSLFMEKGACNVLFT